MRSAAPEDARDGYPTRNRQIRADAAMTRPKSKKRTGRRDKRRVHGHRSTVDGDVELGASHRRKPLVLEPELRPDKRNLEGRRVRFVADQHIGNAMRARVHRPGHWNAPTLPSPAATVLNRGQQAGCDDIKCGHFNAGFKTRGGRLQPAHKSA